MKNFTETIHCTSQKHCGTCRNRMGGASFRESLSKAFAVDGVAFTCPLGKPWTDTHMPPMMPVKDTKQPAQTHPPVPTWDDLRAQIAVAWPEWLPEFDRARAALDGCSTCTDTARRRRWQERIAALPPAG